MPMTLHQVQRIFQPALQNSDSECSCWCVVFPGVFRWQHDKVSGLVHLLVTCVCLASAHRDNHENTITDLSIR